MHGSSRNLVLPCWYSDRCAIDYSPCGRPTRQAGKFFACAVWVGRFRLRLAPRRRIQKRMFVVVSGGVAVDVAGARDGVRQLNAIDKCCNQSAGTQASRVLLHCEREACVPALRAQHLSTSSLAFGPTSDMLWLLLLASHSSLAAADSVAKAPALSAPQRRDSPADTTARDD